MPTEPAPSAKSSAELFRWAVEQIGLRDDVVYTDSRWITDADLAAYLRQVTEDGQPPPQVIDLGVAR